MAPTPASNIPLFYAKILDRATKLVFLVLLVTFAIYYLKTGGHGDGGKAGLSW